MSTAAQVARLVAPFLDRHPEFALVGRSVVLKPVGHLMRRFFLDRTSIKGYVQPSWGVSIMFGPPPDYVTPVGARLVQGVGDVDDPRTQVRLLDEMELIASEILRKADLDDLPALSWKAEPVLGPGPMTFAMPLLAKGAFTEAAPYFATVLARVDAGTEQLAIELRRHRSPDSRPARLDAQLLGRYQDAQQALRTLCDLLAAGEADAIAALLHKWEAAAVESHKVKHIWQPAPFPFEHRS